MAMTKRFATVNGQILFVENVESPGKSVALVPDTLGNVIANKDVNGDIVRTCEYWPYGEIRTDSDSNPTPFGYGGTWGYYTDSSGMLYVRARTYKPVEGRWLTVDPLWPGESAYGYAKGKPLVMIDFDGTSAIMPHWCDGCALTIYANWFPTRAHYCNGCYAHCMACCILSALAGPACAIKMQSVQNFLTAAERFDRERDRHCAKGILIWLVNRKGIPDKQGAWQSACDQQCHRKCPVKYPNPRPDCNKLIWRNPFSGGKYVTYFPSFPYLQRCDPYVMCRYKGILPI